MTDFITVEYGATGASTSNNDMGMRAMQARAYDARNSQYLLIKSPPASGKSRALMFLGLDKLRNQGIKKVIVAVPERSIGASFSSTNLTDHGFFADWTISPQNNLCDLIGGEGGKINAFLRFMKSDDEIIICTHSTLRHAFDRIMKEGEGISAFHECVLAVDEFHHVSADADNRLGELIRAIMNEGSAHLVAMTGSYFRGDDVPVLRPEDEEKFTRVTYTYYEQLSGYEYLKTLGIGYHFYRGSYLTAIGEALDPTKKTIIHIPSVNSNAALREGKIHAMNSILDVLGDVEMIDPISGFQHLRTHDGQLLKVADLVTPETQQTVLNGLRHVKNKDDLDIVIALGMAKEGFDWIWCEHALTIGYRGSLTEVVQIIGRATRDAPGKTHSQFTNLIAEPDTSDDVVKTAVNDMLKAIACSLLMEQVLAPNFNFRTRPSDDRFDGVTRPSVQINLLDPEPTIEITGLKEPTSKRAQEIIQTDMTDLMAAILQDSRVLRASLIPDEFPAETINQHLIPDLITRRYPDIANSEDDVEAIRQNIVARRAVLANLTQANRDSGLPPSEDEDATDGQKAHAQLLKLTSKFITMPDLNIDLIDQVNPFQQSYEILSKALGESVLRRIHQSIAETRIDISEAEALAQVPRIRAFKEQHGKEPSINSANPIEKRMAEALAWIRAAAIRRQKEKAQAA